MNGELAKCAFCGQLKEVFRQYLHAKVKQETGNGFAFISYCNDCGLMEKISEHTEDEQLTNIIKEIK